MDQTLRTQRRELEHRWQEGVAARHTPAGDVRDDVRSSWARSAEIVPWDLQAAPIGPDPTGWSESRFGRASRVILDDLRDLAVAHDLVAALTDESVTITWTSGGRTMARRAESVHFSEGGCWAEAAVGTNALSLAHHTARPATVFSAEHYAPIVHDWVCYSAPVTDPATGSFVGVVDLSGGWQRAHGSMLTTVSALARCVEYELAALDHGGAPVPTATETLRLRALGGTDVHVGDRRLRATRRQVELLTVLALHPEGLNLGELTALVYGDHHVSGSTVKAELSHLRHLLGGRIASRPYRLVGPLDVDLVRLRQALAGGEVGAAIRLYGGPLLPGSESPEIAMWRHHLDVALRDAVLSTRRPDLLFDLGERCRHDVELHQATIGALAKGDPRRSVAAGRLAAAQVD